jgi:hypothetical protein
MRLLRLFALTASASLVMAQPVGTFTPTGSMTTPRRSHKATLLPNGRVLIAGGNTISGKFSPTSSAEVYDPSTGTFAATGNMTMTRLYQTRRLAPER